MNVRRAHRRCARAAARDHERCSEARRGLALELHDPHPSQRHRHLGIPGRARRTAEVALSPLRTSLRVARGVAVTCARHGELHFLKQRGDTRRLRRGTRATGPARRDPVSKRRIACCRDERALRIARDRAARGAPHARGLHPRSAPPSRRAARVRDRRRRRPAVDRRRARSIGEPLVAPIAVEQSCRDPARRLHDPRAPAIAAA